MDKTTTKYFLLFVIGFFILCFVSVVIYQHILGSNKSYVLNKAKKRFENNQYLWGRLVNICTELNNNNRTRELIIGYYPNRASIEVDGKVKNSNGEFIDNLTTEFPELYFLMKNLSIGYATITDYSFEFTLRSIPGKTCLIVYLRFSNNLESIPTNRKWEYKLNDSVYIVQKTY